MGRLSGRAAGFATAAIFGTLLSMALTGHVAGFQNNYFHLPILAGLPGLPQFANDPFIRTMPHFASGLWMLLAGTAPGDRAAPLLLGLAIVSRFASMAGFLACADAMGIRRFRERLLFVALIAFSSIANGYSAAGGAGLLLNTFSHSELANASILLSVWAAGRGRFTTAFALNGVTFFLNAFMAVWMAAPLAAIAAMTLARGDMGWRTMARQMGIGLVPFLVIASPAIALIVGNPSFGRPIGFDFPTYLVQYFPEHFLVWTIGWKPILLLGVIGASGILAGWMLARIDRRAGFCLAALLGFVALWLIGTVLPLLTSSPTLLCLHLLRAGGGIHLFSALALAALTVIWTRTAETRGIWAPLLAVATTTSRTLLPLAVVIVPLGQVVRLPARWRLDMIVAGALILLAWPLQIVGQARENAALRGDIATWRALGLWTKANTEPSDIIMIPIVNILYPPVFPPSDGSQAGLAKGFEVYESFAERRVWIDVRGGGAVPWAPDYYPVWLGRVRAVMALKNHGERIAYARANGIAYLIDSCDNGPARFEQAGRCVYAVGRPAADQMQLAKP